MSAAEELRARELRWMEAVRDRDLDLLERLLALEFTLTTGRPAAPVRSRAEYLEITASRYEIDEFEFEDVEVLDYGEAAVVRSRYRQRGRMDGAERSQEFLMTDVFVRREDEWRAVTRHVSPLAPSE
jgi:ketosteroid isomerase-like protein